MLALNGTHPELPALGGGTFADHADPALVYWLPEGLTLAGSAESPRLRLVLYRSAGGVAGGLLSLALSPAPLTERIESDARAAGWRLERASFTGARYRIRRSPGADPGSGESPPWRPANPSGEVIVNDITSLAKHTAELLADILTTVADPVVVEVEATYAGLIAGLPVLVSADGEWLRKALAAMLGEAPVDADALVAAVQSLPASDRMTMTPLDGPLPQRPSVLAEFGRRLLGGPLVPTSAGGGWGDEYRPSFVLAGPGAVAPGGPAERVLVSLAGWRLTSATWKAQWSVTDAMATMPSAARDAVISYVDNTDPFTAQSLDVLDDLPVDSRIVRSLAVEVRHPGATGAVKVHALTFTGAERTKRVSIVGPPGVAEPEITGTARLTLARDPAAATGWPRRLDPVAIKVSPPVLAVDAAALGVGAVDVIVAPEVFAAAAAVDVQVRDGTDELTLVRLDAAGGPLTLVVPPTATAARVVVTARESTAPGTRSLVLADTSVSAGPQRRTIVIPASTVTVLAPDIVPVSRGDDGSRTPLLVVTLADGAGHQRDLMVGPGEVLSWPCWRGSAFDPAGYRYRVSYIPVAPDGRTLPLTTTDWADGTGPLVIALPDQG